MNVLDKLKQVSVIVADSGDINAIRHYSPQDVTTNPSLLLKAVGLPAYQPLIRDALQYALKQGGSEQIRLTNASDKLAVNVGTELLKLAPGKISTEIDARLSYDRGMCVAKARKLIRLYEQQGVSRSRVLIKLASTWQGVKAAEELKKEGIECNMTLLFSFAQARACAEANVWLISPFVGRIHDWYLQHNPSKASPDPGVLSVRRIYDYYKYHRYPTIIMGSSFRHTNQILALAGCDRLTISPHLLERLSRMEGEVPVRLVPPFEGYVPPTPLTEAEFYWQHNQDPMAVDKLAEGIRQFAADQEKLEHILNEELHHTQAHYSYT
jgi:transaldolase